MYSSSNPIYFEGCYDGTSTMAAQQDTWEIEMKIERNGTTTYVRDTFYHNQTIDRKMVLKQQIQIGENKIYTEKLLSGLYVIKFDKQVKQTKLVKQ